MSNVQASLDAKICRKCAGDWDQEQPSPCNRHPGSEEDVSASLLSEYEHYLYAELPAGETIRLLQLAPGIGDELIECNLLVRSLDSNAAYTALSYTWGDLNMKHAISCSGKRFCIGENLYSALLQFRRDGRTEPLWIDAICINQKNNEEKNAQVRKMRDIYKRAALVICWLGEEEESDDEGFAFMRKLHTQYGHLSPQDFQSTNFKTTDQLGLPDTENHQWKSMAKILYRPYFFRIWIVQEIIAATRCIIQCGIHTIDRASIFAIGAIFENLHFVKDAMGSNIPLPQSADPDADTDELVISYSVQHLWILKVLIDSGETPKICQLLMSTRAFKATNPLDKIYALIGLCSDVSPTFIDYNKHIDEVQIDIAKLCMRNLESWGPMIFSYVDQEHHSDSLPSWVPDWTSGPQMLPLAGSYYDYRTPPAPPPGWHMRSNNQIALKGRLIGEIVAVIHETPYMTPTPRLQSLRMLVHHSRRMDDWEESAWALAASLGTYPTGEKIFEAYWRALIFNRENLDKVPGQDFEWAFKNWNTSFAQCKDESLIELTDLLQQARLGSEHDEPPPSILGRVQRFFSDVYTQGQLFPSNVRLLAKLDLLKRLMKDGAPYEHAFFRYAVGRKFCTNTHGYMGWVPSAAHAGDVFCFFEDCKLPFVLRRCEEGYKLIGDAYLHGLTHLTLMLYMPRKQDIILA